MVPDMDFISCHLKYIEKLTAYPLSIHAIIALVGMSARLTLILLRSFIDKPDAYFPPSGIIHTTMKASHEGRSFLVSTRFISIHSYSCMLYLQQWNLTFKYGRVPNSIGNHL